MYMNGLVDWLLVVNNNFSTFVYMYRSSEFLLVEDAGVPIGYIVAVNLLVEDAGVPIVYIVAVNFYWWRTLECQLAISLQWVYISGGC